MIKNFTEGGLYNFEEKTNNQCMRRVGSFKKHRIAGIPPARGPCIRNKKPLFPSDAQSQKQGKIGLRIFRKKAHISNPLCINLE